MNVEELIEQAFAAQKSSYAPYSNFRVGAALLGKSGKIYQGCNVENASYPASNCAERTAVFLAVAQGERAFEKIAIVGNKTDSTEYEYCPPCGICRQVLREFTDPQYFQIIVARSRKDYRIYTLEELLPESFGPEQLEGK